MKDTNMIKFQYINYPEQTPPGEMLITGQPAPKKVRHLGCLAYSVEEGKVYYGLSICNPKDQFRKSLARLIASRRLESRKFSIEATLDDKHLSQENIKLLLKDAVSRKFTSRHFKKVVCDKS